MEEVGVSPICCRTLSEIWLTLRGRPASSSTRMMASRTRPGGFLDGEGTTECYDVGTSHVNKPWSGSVAKSRRSGLTWGRGWDEAAWFEVQPFLHEKLKVRVWDDAGKHPGLSTRPFKAV